MWKHFLIFTITCLMGTACTGQTASTPTDPPSLVSHFPQQINTPNAYMDALIRGRLVLANGCLRVNDADGNSILLIWRPGFSTRTEAETVQVIGPTGMVVAEVGDFVEVGGGGDSNPAWIGLTEPLPDECPGPYFIVGESIKKIDYP